MYEHAQRPAGPDFLASFAEANLTSGLDVNAHEFRVRASEWRDDKTTIEQLRDQVDTLEARLYSAQLALAGNA